MHMRGQSFGVIGALRAFPLRLAVKRVESMGGRLHRTITRGTTIAVVGRTLLSRYGEPENERKIDAAKSSTTDIQSENGFLRALGTLPTAAGATMSRQALLDQSGLDPRQFDLLALFDAFEHHTEPFSFRDIILARKYAGLVASGAGWSAIARAIHQIGPVGSLTALSLHAVGSEKILSRDTHSLAELDGQRLLNLSDEDEEGEDYFGLAESAEAAGLLPEAAALYAQCSAIDPTDATAAFNHGNCLRALGDLHAAAHAYTMALKRDPLFVEAWFNYGGLLRDTGKLQAARQHLAKAVELDATYADAIYNLAALDYDSVNMAAAKAGWQRYLELDTTSDWARRARAGIAVIDQHLRKFAG